MLRRLLDQALQLVKKDKYKPFTPVVNAIDAFCFEPNHEALHPPFVRDATDIKRSMILVVIALLPTIFMAIWNSGLQKIVFSSGNTYFLQTFYQSSNSFKDYLYFTLHQVGLWKILFEGSKIFLPLVMISYAVGGTCEVLFAIIRKHPIAEGLLVTGILYPLTLPPTIPYWMAALGIAFGIVVSKELFGGTGMNILNPALVSRAFLFFTYPSKMSGDVWVGSNVALIKNSLLKMNASVTSSLDGISQATCLQTLNAASSDIKRIHIDAIANKLFNIPLVPTKTSLIEQLQIWKNSTNNIHLADLSLVQLKNFITTPIDLGGLGLMPSQFENAYALTDVIYGVDKFSFMKLFFGNTLGSLGETSTFACLLGAFLLLITRVASWRTILAFSLGAFSTAWLFKWVAALIFGQLGAWAPASFFIPAHRHLVMGGLAFGIVFMASDPVSSPTLKTAKWLYGLLIGFLTILIRLVNPAYPEGVMLAILIGNVSAPLLDHFAIRKYRRKQA